MTIRVTAAGLRDIAVVLGLYVASTALFALLGVTFDMTPTEYFMQFIDPQLMQARFFESIWYWHATPPMLNVIYGIGMHAFGEYQSAFYSVLYHALGLLTGVAVWLLTWKLGGSRIAAGIATGLVFFNPDFVLYQNWLMYEMPAVAFLTLAAWALYRYVETRSMKWAVALFSLLAALLLTRSVFHLACMVLIVGALALLCREHWRQVLTAAALPVLIVAGWYAKNLYQVGSFSSSTWMGLGFTNISTLILTRPELLEMVQRGEISALALVSRYDDRELLFSATQGPPSGIPVLDNKINSTRAYNYNYRPLVAFGRKYTEDGLKVIRSHPGAYVIGLTIANRLFFSPNNVNPFFLLNNRDAALKVNRVLMPVLYGVRPRVQWVKIPRYGFERGVEVPVHMSVPLAIAWLLVLGYGYMQMRSGLRAADRAVQARAIVIGFILLTCLWVYALGTALELGENYRYRFLTDSLFMVLEVTAITALVRKLRRSRSTNEVSTPSPAGASV